MPAFADTPPVLEIKQGDAAYIEISSPETEPVLVGTFRGKKVFFNRMEEIGQFGLLFGVDLDEPGSGAAAGEITDLSGSRVFFRIQVAPGQFERQTVTVAPQFVNPSRSQLTRIEREKEELHAILSIVSEIKMWKGNFIVPVAGIREGRFGSRRVFNGEARNPHSGEDIAAPEGTPVLSSNDGRVAGVVDHFFSGRGVIIEHGQGIFTEYFHLSRTLVRKGMRVHKGEEIGKVGHSGRATGPHLHWGMLINGARVDPYSVVRLDLEGTGKH
jgi:murein DD-endopeptidase MepM/ murein hydrolase activator NlpD